MTLRELIERLVEIEEEFGPDTEVRLASQPSWPLEWTVAGISTLHPRQDEIEELRQLMGDTPREDWPEDAEEQLARLCSEQHVVWICEGRHLGYTSRSHWEEL